MLRIRIVLFAALLCVPAAASGERADISWVESWCYWLQAPDVNELAASTYDVAVMDYSYDGSESGEFSYSDIETVRDSGKIAMAYLSIAEAEDYRFYWKSNWRVGKPGFIVAENPWWEGNYKVKYWTNGWWNKAIQPYLDRIIAQGFDGVYLDGIGDYWWWYEEMGHNPVRAANRMVNLVKRIADYCRTQTGEYFIVCPQNGVSLLDDASSTKASLYLDTVDAVAVESLYYNYWSIEDQEYQLEKLAAFDDAGRKILVVDYIDEDEWDNFFASVQGSGLDMVGYPAAPDFLLDELIDLG